MERLFLVISGDVTGVGYRAWVKREAEKMGIRGWVRNAEKGVVEAVFEGEEGVLEKMVEKCEEEGVGTEISRMEVRKDNSTEGLKGFEIKA